MSNNPYFKNNSFTKTPGIPQIASYAVFLLETVLYYVVVLPHLESLPSKVTLGILYSIFLLLLIVFTVLSSLNDPSDSAMIMYRNDREKYNCSEHIVLKVGDSHTMVNYSTVTIV